MRRSNYPGTKDIDARLERIGPQAARSLTPQFGVNTNRMVWDVGTRFPGPTSNTRDEGVQQRIKTMLGIFVGNRLDSQVYRDAR